MLGKTNKEKQMACREIEGHSVHWTDCIQPTPEDLDEIRERFHVSPIHLQDIRIGGQRPKLEAASDYLFLVLLFPVYNRSTREITPSEIDFLVMKDAVVTIHDGSLASFNELSSLLQENEGGRQRLLGDGGIGFVYACVDRLLSACNPMLDHISRDLRTVEQKIFNGAEREMVSDILISRRNITDFRRIMQAHKNTLRKFVDAADEHHLFHAQAQATAFNQLIEQTKELWEHLASFKETVEALHATNESLISHNLNVIMRKYTTISVIIFAMTLVAALFAIEVDGQPLLHLDFGFWYIVLVEAILGAGLYFIFKRIRWT
jgi:magnesium transporter